MPYYNYNSPHPGRVASHDPEPQIYPPRSSDTFEYIPSYDTYQAYNGNAPVYYRQPVQPQHVHGYPYDQMTYPAYVSPSTNPSSRKRTFDHWANH